ncbi:hypothetical protein DV736_g5995, partial [Chaetothyriales sp. CBS 134916]
MNGKTDFVLRPTVIRRDVRDKFDSTEGPLQERLKYLKDTIGYPVRFIIDWALLWNECEPNFADKSTFVPNVLSQLTSFCDALASQVNDESSSWTEQLLEKIESVREIRVNVQVALSGPDLAKDSSRQGQSTDNQTSAIRASDDQTFFILLIPSKPLVSSTSSTQLLQDLDKIFSTAPEPSKLEEDDEWASDSIQLQPILTPVASFSTTSESAQPSIQSSVPVLSALPRPDLLFSRNTPYIIHLRYEGHRVVLQSTHQPSLNLIHDYFSKWSRGDPLTRDKVPLLRKTLVASSLGPGTYYDTLVVEYFSQVSSRSGIILNPSLFECFIESVLGYEAVGRGNANAGGGNGVFWEFRRTAAFI